MWQCNRSLIRLWVALSVATCLAGCATSTPHALRDNVLWQDTAFHFGTGPAVESAQSIFELDEAMVTSLRSATKSGAQNRRKLELLLAHLYGPKGIRLSYTSGHSTGAAQTWRNQAGDCMSLTLLAYSAAKTLGVPAFIQEVEVPPLIDRRNGVDFLIGHVNVFVPMRGPYTLQDQTYDAGGLVIDFEPSPTSMRHGVVLSEPEILARYYNNRAAEFMLRGDDDLAYAYYKAALQADARYGPAYGNLAQLYYRHSLVEPAEALLRHAVTLTDSADAPVRTLQRLLKIQGRDAEAQELQAAMLKRRDRDPYYWLALGRDHLAGERFDTAVAALERAQSLSTGFTEVHVSLAAAYWRNGQEGKAQAQMAKLQELDDGPAAVELLNRKMTALRSDHSLH